MLKSPYKLYSVQREILSDMKEWWKGDKKHMLIQAPTGTGKTVLHLIFAMLKISKGHRVVYFSREHAQIEQCMFELKSILSMNDIPVRAVHIAGKSHSCLHENVRTIREIDAQETACEDYTSVICGYQSYIKKDTDPGSILTLLPEYRNLFYSFDVISNVDSTKRLIEESMVEETSKQDIIDELFRDKIASNEVIMDIASKYSMCPRTLQKWAMDEANLIFAPYNYMVIPRFEPNSSNDIYIIDESHNLDSNIASMHSVNVHSKSFTNYFSHIQRNMKLGFLNPPNNKVLKPFVSYGNHHDYELHGNDLKKMLDSITEDDILNLQELLTDIVNKSVRSTKSSLSRRQEDRVPKYFKTMLKFVTAIKRLKSNYRRGYVTREKNIITIDFVDTDVIFNEISRKAKKIIISSGSLYPKYMAAYLGLTRSDSEIYEYNPPHKNRHNIGCIISSYDGNVMNTTWKNRTNDTYLRYAKIIKDVYEENDTGTLVYFTSYAFRDNIGEYLNRWGIKYYNPDEIDQYRADIEDGKRAIFMSAFRGLGSEGWNLGDDQSRAIVLVGIPYLPSNVINVKAQQMYYNSRKKGLGVAWYNQKATLWLMQSFGRGLRHKNDYTTVYFVDSRVMKIRQYFIEWVKKATNWKSSDWLNGRSKIRKDQMRVL